MERALKLRNDLQSAIGLPLLLSAGALLVFIALLQISTTGIALLFAFGSLGGIAVFLLPIEYSILAFFLYLFLDGAIKINTNYNPIFHVAQDLILMALCLRSVIDRENGGIKKFFKTPFASLICLFLVWILVQYLNPFGLGLLPSIAGTKVYFSGILLFLLSYQHLRKESFEAVIIWLTFLGLLEGLLATVEYLYFQGFVFSLHPKYAELAGESFSGDLFRPFGTTAAPGAPSVWIFLTSGMAMYLLLNSSRLWPKALGAAHLLFAIPTLIFCQTRAAMILTLINMGIVLVCPHGSMKRRFGMFVALSLLAGITVTIINSDAFFEATMPGASSGLIAKNQIKVLRERALSLLDQDVMTRARGGAFDASMSLAEHTPFGIGLSRVGAASAVWRNRIMEDKYFNVRWSFADNLYRAVFTELGIFGLIFWLLLTVSISLFHIRNSFLKAHKNSASLLWLCGAYPMVALVGGIGSEGILYNPTSGFFWLLLAIGLKEVSSDPAQV